MADVQIISAVQPLEDTVLVSRHGGVVAERARWQGQDVFVKTLESRDIATARRFEHEGAVASRLNHPQLAALLARSPTQLLFSWIEGCTLRERVEQGPLAVPEALRITAGVLRGLCELHMYGITHQDLKPENVIVAASRPEAAAVRLIDFGMSHARDLPLDIHRGTRMGTPHFMAPEQFRGLRGEPRSDLYSAGVLLFDCLAGHPPYEDAMGWLAGLHDQRAPLPGPGALHPLMLASLQREPQDRPESAQAMLGWLSQVAGSLGVDLDAHGDPTPNS
ncbi:serine/threonine-protein kinase [Deinococcus malanensis]|nr:serine/threonine-protein kinase [Deinococcus malanensis]